MRRLGLFIAIPLLLGARIATAQGFGWTKTITIERTRVGTGGAPQTLTNFPLLVSTVDPDLRSVANGGRITGNAGEDIIFRGLNAEVCGGPASCPLDHQLERYVAATGELIAWVRLPFVNTTNAPANTAIRIFYGNAGITSPTQRRNDVWDIDFRGVWHMFFVPAPQMLDSTRYLNHCGSFGTLVSSAVVPAQIGDGIRFDPPGNVGIDCGDIDALDGVPQVTFSVWARYDQLTADRAMLSKFVDPNSRIQLGVCGGGAARDDLCGWVSDGAATNLAVGDAYTVGAWQYWTMVFDGTQPLSQRVRIYRDGALLTSNTTLTGPLPSLTKDTNASFIIGANSSGGVSWPGVLDEVRVSTVARSADWVLTEFNNASSPGTFVAVGTEAPNVEPDFTQTVKVVVDLNGGVIEPGDVLEFVITTRNTGSDGAEGVLLRDGIPTGVTFVPGSLRVDDPNGVVSPTDALDTDTGDYETATRTVHAALGLGASGASGGQMQIGASGELRFRVTVDSGATGTLLNEAVVSGHGTTFGPPGAEWRSGTGVDLGTPTPIPIGGVPLPPPVPVGGIRMLRVGCGCTSGETGVPSIAALLLLGWFARRRSESAASSPSSPLRTS